MEFNEVYALRSSGYWAWLHRCEWGGWRFYQVHGSEEEAVVARARHVRLHGWRLDEIGYYLPPPDWRCYA